MTSRLLGTIGEAAAATSTTTAAPTAAASAGVDLLSPPTAARSSRRPNDEWLKLNDGKPDRATTYAGEGIWGFKDGKAATFDRFEMLIPGADEYTCASSSCSRRRRPGRPVPLDRRIHDQNTKLISRPTSPSPSRR